MNHTHRQLENKSDNVAGIVSGVQLKVLRIRHTGPQMVVTHRFPKKLGGNWLSYMMSNLAHVYDEGALRLCIVPFEGSSRSALDTIIVSSLYPKLVAKQWRKREFLPFRKPSVLPSQLAWSLCQA